jgi:arsenate reductase
MKKVLILCTGNSCRSQLAEGFIRHFAGNKALIYSAGVEIHGLNPKAVQIMAEHGIDISKHTSNHLDEYAGIDFDYVITVCDHARESCPYFPSRAEKIHQNFPDPAKATGTEAEIIQVFRSVSEQIKSFSADFVGTHLNGNPQ